MADEELLAAAPSGSVVAPAGHGKTELIVRTTALGDRTLILTHTHAGLHALKARLKRLGVPTSKFAVDTIDGWCMRYARAFPTRGKPPTGMPQGNEWNCLRTNALSVLDVSGVRDVVRSSYSRVLIDEYQDCDPGQHALSVALSKLVPTIVFGDPMQGIFEFANAKLIWRTDVYPHFPLLLELKVPHRWETKNPELGRWIAETRGRLERGERIDLAEGPIVFRQADRAFDMGAFFEGLDEREGNTAGIHCRRGMCENLARATKGMYQAIEEVQAKRLTKFCREYDRADTQASRLEAIKSLRDECFHQRKKEALETDSPEHAETLRLIKLAVESLGNANHVEHTREVFRLARRHPRWRCYRGELWRDTERVLTEVASGRSADLASAAQIIRQRLSASGRLQPRRTISTPLLLKGLEFEHVLIPDARHFLAEDQAQAKLFYVAVSRATMSLLITAPDRFIQFPKPRL
jgi:AAA domain